MRLYLSADSKENMGYTADWLMIHWMSNGKPMQLTLDLQGETDFNRDSLNIRFKGDAIPWVYVDEAGDETDLYELGENEVEERFSNKQLIELMKNATGFTVGLYPIDDSEEGIDKACKDVLTNKTAFLTLFDGEKDFELDFDFEYEMNIY